MMTTTTRFSLHYTADRACETASYKTLNLAAYAVERDFPGVTLKERADGVWDVFSGAKKVATIEQYAANRDKF